MGQAKRRGTLFERISEGEARRIAEELRRQYEERNMQLQKEFDQYRRNSEEAIKRSLKIGEGYQVSIESHGDVFVHGGRTVQVQ